MPKREYPEESEEWSKGGERYFTYRIHSRTTDGWTRYYASSMHPKTYPLYCMPTDEFMRRYERVVW